ncbi:MAG: spore coat protein [Firmicutes bacterium]|nr:spore coat protein [Bacillota bacterium]
MQFSDKDIMFDLLLGTKFISSQYHTAVLESANDRIRNTLIQLNNDEINLQKQMFNLMHDRNWYPVRPAGVAAVASAGTGAVGMQQQMPY